MSVHFARSGLLAAALFMAVLVVGCGVRDARREARANRVRARVASAHAYFREEAETICAELPTAETPTVPPLETDCSGGCRCSASSDGDDLNVATYDCGQWNVREWQLLRFVGQYTESSTPSGNEYFHYRAKWRKTAEGCRLDITVLGDLDGDGVHSTYTSWLETTADGFSSDLPEVDVLWK